MLSRPASAVGLLLVLAMNKYGSTDNCHHDDGSFTPVTDTYAAVPKLIVPVETEQPIDEDLKHRQTSLAAICECPVDEVARGCT